MNYTLPRPLFFLQTTVLKDFEHGSVVREDIGLERGDAEGSSNTRQVVEQQGADTPPLEVVPHNEGDLGPVLALPAHKPPYPYELPTRGTVRNDSDEGNMIVEVELGEIAELGVRQLALGLEESVVDGLRRELVKPLTHGVAILRGDCPDQDRCTIPECGHDVVLTGIHDGRNVSPAARSRAVRRAAYAECTAIQDVGVDHGGADIMMPEKLLDGADVIAILQQMGGKGMPEAVAGGPLLHP